MIRAAQGITALALIVAGVYGLAGVWAALLCAGVLLLVDRITTKG